MKFLINGEILKELNSFNSEFTASIATRLNANGVMLDDVLWVYDTLRNKNNYHALVRHNHTVDCLARFNKAYGVMERLNAVLPALKVLWNKYALQYNRIVARGVRCKTQGVWDVFRNIRKNLNRGKAFAFTVGKFRLESGSDGAILLKYGDGLDKTLTFVRNGDSYRVSCDSHVCEPVWLNLSTGKVECKKKGLFQDVLSILQAPVWETEDLPTHVCFMMCPPAFIMPVLTLPFTSAPDALGAAELFEMCRRARGV